MSEDEGPEGPLESIYRVISCSESSMTPALLANVKLVTLESLKIPLPQLVQVIALPTRGQSVKPETTVGVTLNVYVYGALK